MDQNTVIDIAQKLTQARLKTAPVKQFSEDIKEFPRTQAYAIQEKGIEHRVSEGEKVIGLKMGLTSEAKRKQMDLDAPLYGELTDKMEIQNEGTYSLSEQIHPKIEPEIAFLMKDSMKGKVTREEVLGNIKEVYACMEILDSRYEQFKYFSMEDVISDNSSSSQYILGNPITDFSKIDLANLSMKMYVNDSIAHEGNSKAISGDPLISVVQLCELLNERGRELPAGSLVLTGAATAAVKLEEKQQIKLEVENLGSVSVVIEK